MKKILDASGWILFIIFLMFGMASQGQTTAQQLSALKAQDVIINKSIVELNAAIVKLLAIVAEQDAKIAAMPAWNPVPQSNQWFADSVKPYRTDLLYRIEKVQSAIPSYLTLYIDTLTGLKFKQDTLYFKK